MVLASTAQQSRPVIQISSFSDFHPIYVTPDHWVEFPELHSSFSSAIYFILIYSSVCMSTPLTQFIPQPIPNILQEIQFKHS